MKFLSIFVLLSLAALADVQSDWEKHYSLVDSYPATKADLPPLELLQIFKEASDNPVSNLDIIYKYDPTGEIGFCFGRAMSVHLTARLHSVKSESVRKLFVIGDLRSGPDPEWRFHVTTTVLGNDGKWYAIDPIMTPPLAPGTPQLMQDWIKTVQSVWDTQKKAHFYWVDNTVVTPDLRVVPAPDEEDGTRVIELKFNPKDRPGFSEVRLENQTIYRVSLEAGLKYFTGVNEVQVEDRFPVSGMTINGTYFDFRHYFEDLIQTFLPPAPSPTPATSLPAFKWGSERHRNLGKSLGSPRVESWFK